MNKFNTERSKPWNIYPSSESQINSESTQKNLGTSMNAISIGFVATAILISMFLIMAVFEHLFKPNASLPSPQESFESLEESRPHQKLAYPPSVSKAYSSNFSVLMPGQRYPTCIAQAAPLPCPREGTHWPSHEHNFIYP
ncbi:hypothetical protein LguiA_008505 [Lonicera macranthoides]